MPLLPFLKPARAVLCYACRTRARKLPMKGTRLKRAVKTNYVDEYISFYFFSNSPL